MKLSHFVKKFSSDLDSAATTVAEVKSLLGSENRGPDYI
jgi:hypothetical protein